MTARALIDDLSACGVRFSTDGAYVDIDGPADVITEAVLATIRRMKDDILAALSTPSLPPAAPRAPAWTAADWCEYFAERLAVAMVNGEQPEAEAQVIAHECCVVRWLDMHTVETSPERCAHCGRPDAPGAIVVPYGTGPHVWLHPQCWRPWFAGRRADAETALAAMGITR